MLNFDQPSNQPNSIIKVIGVGGGGSNAVNHMFKLGIRGVDFIVCNTDKQALEISPVPHKIQLGATLTEGLGAGAVPEVGKNAAIESIEEITSLLCNNTKMVFITAGMGGGTGTGAAPVIAQIAKDLGILTVGIVTLPFGFEGKKRFGQAELGLEELKRNVDTLLIISNNKLREIYGDLKLREAFAKADDVLSTAAKSIAEIISLTLHINVDFNDIRTVMQNSGRAIMGSSSASGEGRAIRAVEQALSSPLLDDNNISGARYVLLNITSGNNEELSMDELGEITDYIQEAAGQTAEIIQGYGVDEELTEDVKVTIIATGFNSKDGKGLENKTAEVKRINLIEDEPAPAPIPTPTLEAEPLAKIQEAPVAEDWTTKLYEEPRLKVVDPFVAKQEEPVIEEPINNVKIDLNEFTLRIEESVEEEKEEFTFELPVAETHVVEEVETPKIIVHKLDEETFTFNEPVINYRTEEVKQTIVAEQSKEIYSNHVNRDELFKRSQERIAKLKNMSFKIKTPNGLSEIENEPAYVRRGVMLNNVNHSSQSNVSRYTLSEGEDKKIEIKPNNPFLSDNAD
jgi:cell division protein FtsZ